MTARPSAWYAKSLPTFSDTLAVVRQRLWFFLLTFPTSGEPPDVEKILEPFLRSLVETLSYAA